MRKAAVFVAVVFAAALSSSSSFAAGKADPAVQAQKDTANFMSGAMNPGMTKDAAMPAKKGHRHHHKKKKM
jgi:hypothetical protein